MRSMCLSALLLLWLPCVIPAQTPSVPKPGGDALTKALVAARTSLVVSAQGLSGPGGAVLTSAIDQARYVLIGEEHFTREVPQFATAVCDEMAPRGLTAYAVEASSAAAAFVQNSFGQPQREESMAALTGRFPESVAFLNSRQENQVAESCAEAVQRNGHALQLWGLDQEFLGAGGWILSRMLATHPGPKARAAIETMQGQARAEDAEARRTGDFLKLFLPASTDAQIAAAQQAIDADGSRETKEEFAALTESRAVYRERATSVPDSNMHRAIMLKQNFQKRYEAAGGAGARQRVLVKFGDNHLSKGFNPIHNRDLGNYLAEHADVEGSRSLHIAVAAIEGDELTPGRYGEPWHATRVDTAKDAPWFVPAIDARIPDGWTLYDLRRLRFGGAGELGSEWTQLVYGYDFLVLIPRVSAGELLR